MGDLHIAPDDRDVHSPRRWAGQVLVNEAERAAFRALLEVGLSDAFRQVEPPPGVYSWWKCGALAFTRNWGLRIDHVLVSDALGDRCVGCEIDRGPRGHDRPSDHAPVLATFTLP